MIKPLTIAYFGTPYFSADFLKKILTDNTIPVKVKLVVTQPDKPVGRKQIITPSPVKLIAQKYSIPIVANIHDAKNLETSISKIDLALVYAYGEIIPKEMLQVPKYGFWNIHPSLLPLYRGPSPIATTILEGQTKTGVTLITLDEKIDHGPIIDQVAYDILPDERRPDLENKLTNLGFELFKKNLNLLITNGKINNTPQNHGRATFTKPLTKAEGFIPNEILNTCLAGSPRCEAGRQSKYKIQTNVYDKFRALYPWPGIWTKVKINGVEKRLKITDMDANSIKKVQLEGKKEVELKTFISGYPYL